MSDQPFERVRFEAAVRQSGRARQPFTDRAWSLLGDIVWMLAVAACVLCYLT